MLAFEERLKALQDAMTACHCVLHAVPVTDYVSAARSF